MQKQPPLVPVVPSLPGGSVPTGWPTLPPQGPPIPERVPGWVAPGGQAVLPAANAGQAQKGDNLGLAKSMRGYGAFLMERGVANKARKLFARADEILVG